MERDRRMNGMPEKDECPRILELIRYEGKDDEITITYRCTANEITREDVKQVVDILFLNGVTWLEIKIPAKSDVVHCSCCGGKK